MFNKKINKKGFAVTTMLYGIVFVTIAIFFGTITIASNHKQDNDKFVENIRENIEESNNSKNEAGDSNIPIGESSDLLIRKMIEKMDKATEFYPEIDSYTCYIFGYWLNENEKIDFNYVWYSGKLWRIVSFCGDGTIKMITEDSISEISFGSSNTYNKNSYIYQWLNEDFKDTLYNYKNMLVQDYSWKSTTYADGEVKKENKVSGTVGLLSKEEFENTTGLGNHPSYLTNVDHDDWYTLDFEEDLGVLLVGYPYYLLSPFPPDNFFAVRPVIVLKPSTLIYNGDGTKENPYRLKGDIEGAAPNTTLLNTRVSGEYVKFDDEIYRIMGIESKTTKLIMPDVLKDENGKNLEKNFSGNAIYGNKMIDDDYCDYYLNNTWYNNISEKYRKMMVKGTYYLGKYTYKSYKSTICKTAGTATTKACTKTTSKWTGYVGLPRVGEMYFESETGNRNSVHYLISPYDSKKLVFAGDYLPAREWCEDEECHSPDKGGGLPVRPTITLSADVVITGGNGRSPETAFEIALPTEEAK